MVYFGTVAVFLKHSKNHSKRRKTIEGAPHPPVITTQDGIFNWHFGWEYVFSFSYPEVTSPTAKVQYVFSPPSSGPHMATVLSDTGALTREPGMMRAVRRWQCFFEKYWLFQRTELLNITAITITISKCIKSVCGKPYIYTCCMWNIFSKHIFHVKSKTHLCELPYCLVILYSESMFTHISQKPNNLPLLHESWASNNYFPNEIWVQNLEFALYRKTVTLGKLDLVIYFCYTFFTEDENSRTFMYFLLI